MQNLDSIPDVRDDKYVEGNCNHSDRENNYKDTSYFSQFSSSSDESEEEQEKEDDICSMSVRVEKGSDGIIVSCAKDVVFNDSSDDSFGTLMTELAENSVSQGVQ